MITYKEALEKAKSDNQKGELIEALDFGSFYGFIIGEKGKVYSCYTTINKKNGNIGFFNPTSNFELFETAKKISEESS